MYKKSSKYIVLASLYLFLAAESYSNTIILDDSVPFDRSIVFGDSLSDNGTYSDLFTSLKGLYTTDGRFSNGMVWNEYLFPKQKRGIVRKWLNVSWTGNGDFTKQSAQSDSNVNYAVGGATYLSTSHFIIPTISDQIETFIRSGDGKKAAISPDTLVTIWAGGNDALAVFSQQQDAFATARGVKKDLRSQLERLYAQGGRHFLVPDLPDFSLVPRLADVDVKLTDYASKAFNEGIEKAVRKFKTAHPDVVVYTPDIAGMMATVHRHPDVFGFTNVTEPCVQNADCFNEPRGSEKQNAFMYWDDIHPTTRTHNYIANYFREYWQNPEVAGFHLTSPASVFTIQREIFFPESEKVASGALTGDRAVYKLNVGTLIFTGENDYTGGTFVREGELQIGSGGQKGSIRGDVELESHAQLSFNRNNLLEFDGVIRGEGRVEQKGSGLTVLTAEHDYTGDTIIRNGGLVVNGSINSTCPSSNDLRLFVFLKIGVSGSVWGLI